VSSEALLSSVIPFAGSGLLGYAMGFALTQKMTRSLDIRQIFTNLDLELLLIVFGKIYTGMKKCLAVRNFYSYMYLV
jgi:hypothetical protein